MSQTAWDRSDWLWTAGAVLVLVVLVATPPGRWLIGSLLEACVLVAHGG